MKRFSIIVLASLAAFVASAGWVATPLDITVETAVAPVLIVTTGTVTELAAPAAGDSYYLTALTVSQIEPLPLGTHTVATTGTVTTVESPSASESYALTLIRCDTLLSETPANPTNTCTVDFGGGVSYVFSNATPSVATDVTVTNETVITVTLGATVTNLPALTFYRVWLPDTNTVAVTLITESGATTNAYSLSNGASTAGAGVWVTEDDSITVTLSDTVTNLPAITMSRIDSPVTKTYLLTGNAHWNLYGARPGSALVPGGTGTSVSVSINYAGGETVAYASFTNGAAGVTSDAPTRLIPRDAVTVTAKGVTNSPTVRVLREAWQD